MQVIKYSELELSVDIPYHEAFQHIFNWLISGMDNWNTFCEASKHPKISARMVTLEKTDKSTTLELRVYSEGKIVLMDCTTIFSQDNYLSEIVKWSRCVMLKVIHFGFANLILLTPINKN